ncbi:MAG: hypothetical protein ACOYVK_17830 [Bacillota bacterium]
MISIFRNGPKLVVFNSSEIDILMDDIIKELGGVETNIHDAFEMADEDNTIIFLGEPGKTKLQIEDIKATVYVPMASDELFTKVINGKLTNYIDDSHISPGLLIMRTVGDSQKIIESVREAYHGNIMTLNECLNIGTINQTIISFTDRPVNRKLSLNDLDEKHILVDTDIHTVSRKMRSQILRFFNEGFQDKNWYDLQIRVYDRYSQYMVHYERLARILDALDVGLILGESWGKDHPRFMMSVMVYQVRLFTLLNPLEIKKILVGLEHLDDGSRIVDLDLLHKGNKIDWPMAIEKPLNIKDRKMLGQEYRKRILNRLTVEDKEILKGFEEKIIQSRY